MKKFHLLNTVTVLCTLVALPSHAQNTPMGAVMTDSEVPTLSMPGEAPVPPSGPNNVTISEDEIAAIQAFLTRNPAVWAQMRQIMAAEIVPGQRGSDRAWLEENGQYLFDEPLMARIGDPDADHQVAAFVNWNNPETYRVANELIQLAEAGDMNVTFVEFPTGEISGLTRSRMAMAAYGLEGFDGYRRIIEAMTQVEVPSRGGAMEEYIPAAGMDVRELSMAYESIDVMDQILLNMDMAFALRINDAPALVVDDRVVRPFELTGRSVSEVLAHPPAAGVTPLPDGFGINEIGMRVNLDGSPVVNGNE